MGHGRVYAVPKALAGGTAALAGGTAALAGGLLDKGELHPDALRQQRRPACDSLSHCADSFLNGMRSRIYDI